jgi:purine-cytosine permease-like protein
MEKFKEKKIVKILDIVVIIMLLSFIINLCLVAFSKYFLLSLFLLPIILLIILIENFVSQKSEYTIEFLKYIENKLEKAVNLEDYNKILEEFTYLAISKYGLYELSFPKTLRSLNNKILNQIQILEKIKEINFLTPKDLYKAYNAGRRNAEFKIQQNFESWYSENYKK